MLHFLVYTDTGKRGRQKERFYGRIHVNHIFPECMKKGDEYLIPDFKWEEFQMVKQRSSIRLC